MKKRLPLTAGLAVGVALVILGVTLFGPGSQTALADDADGVITGIDMDPTNGGSGGNTATFLDSIDQAADHCKNATAGEVFDIDIWLDDLEAGPPNNDESYAGSQFDLMGWPASGTDGVAPQISAKDHLLLLNAAASSSVFDISEAVPDADPAQAAAGPPNTSDYLAAFIDLGTAEYVSAGYTQGVIARYTIDTAGATPGLYKLTLEDVIQVRDLPPFEMLNQAIWDSNYSDALGSYGLLAVDVPCPVGADVKKLDLQAIGVPAQALVSTEYTFTLRAVLHNNGPDDPVDVEDVTAIAVPAGIEVSFVVASANQTITIDGAPMNCTAPGAGGISCTNNVVNGVAAVSTKVAVNGNDAPGTILDVHETLSLADSLQTNLDQDWDFHCLNSGNYLLPFTDMVNVLAPSFELDPGNNSDFVDVSVVCVLPDGDVKITDQYFTEVPTVKPPLTLPTIIVQESNTLTLRKVLHNNGVVADVATDITMAVSLDYAGMDPANGDCVVTPPGPVQNQVTLPLSSAIDYDETFNIVCSQGGLTVDDDSDGVNDEDMIGGPGVDNDGDSAVDEDACNSLDDDGDTQIDEDPANGDDDCDGSIDEDSPFYLVTVTITNTIDPKPPVVDPDQANNVAVTSVTLAVIRPFTPTFVATIDDTDPGLQVDPVTDTCFPGVPCKRREVINILSPPPTVSFPGDQPLPVEINTIIGSGPGQWTHATGLAIKAGTGAYGEKVGDIDFSIYSDYGLPGVNNCTTPFGGSNIPLYNACLPPTADDAEDTGGDTGGPGSCYDGIDNGGGDGGDLADPDDCTMVHPITGDQYVKDDACDVDNLGAGTALVVGPVNGPGTAELSWSSRLDHTVNAVIHSQPTAYLWARFAGYAELMPATYIPINILIFDLSGGLADGPWLEVTALGDPDQPPQPPNPIDFCTPYMSDLLILGEGETSAVPILTCNVGTAQRPFFANFRRPIGETDQLTDSVTCAGLPVEADKEVTAVEFDKADGYPDLGTELPYDSLLGPPGQTFSIKPLSEDPNANLPFSVTSREINHGPYEPADAEISFYVDVPASCEGRWVPDGVNFPFDVPTIAGDENVPSSGTPYAPPVKVPGPVRLDLHFQTADYGIAEPMGVPVAMTRFFEVHCAAEGMYQFQFCNRADVMAPDTDSVPGNNLMCEDMWVLTPLAPGCPNSDASPYDGAPIAGNWDDCKEQYIGTDYNDDCPDNVDDDALPTDLQGPAGMGKRDATVNILDVVAMKPYLGTSNPRYDLSVDYAVNIVDVVLFKPELAKAWPCP